MADRALDGTLNGWRRKRYQVLSAQKAVGAIARYSAVRFNEQLRLQTEQVDCVLPKGRIARDIVRAWFEPRRGGGAVSNARPATSWTGTQYCLYDVDDDTFDCGGVFCGDGLASRMAGLANPRAARALMQNWVCSNGCIIMTTANEIGYDCGGGGGGVTTPGSYGTGGGTTGPFENIASQTMVGLTGVEPCGMGMCATIPDASDDYCLVGGAGSMFCNGEIEDPNLAAAAFAGRYTGMITCPEQMTFQITGSHLGVPAHFYVGVKRRFLFETVPGFSLGTGAYSAAIHVEVSAQELKYRGALQADCADGSYIAVGIRRL